MEYIYWRAKPDTRPTRIAYALANFTPGCPPAGKEEV